MTIRATIQDEMAKIQEYFRKMTPHESTLSECLRQQKPSEEKEQIPSWIHTLLHRLYHRQIEEVADTPKVGEGSNKSQKQHLRSLSRRVQS